MASKKRGWEGSHNILVGVAGMPRLMHQPPMVDQLWLIHWVINVDHCIINTDHQGLHELCYNIVLPSKDTLTPNMMNY